MKKTMRLRLMTKKGFVKSLAYLILSLIFYIVNSLRWTLSISLSKALSHRPECLATLLLDRFSSFDRSLFSYFVHLLLIVICYSLSFERAKVQDKVRDIIVVDSFEN